MHFGLNLISYNCSFDGSLQELLEGSSISNVLGEGVASTKLPNGQWVGSLDSFEPGKGYWVNAAEPEILEYECEYIDLESTSRKKRSY